MKKIIQRFSLLITFSVILALSYIIKLIGIYNQKGTFVCLVGVYIFLMALKILLEVLTNDSQTSKMLLILLMIGIYGLIILSSWVAFKMLNVDIETAFQLITFGIVIGNIMNVKKKKEEKHSINEKEYY